jgi:hypothetical protein
MTDSFVGIFSCLKPVLSRHSKRLTVKVDTPTEYVVTGKSPSPFPQHKGQPLDFGYVRLGKSYVSIHLMALGMTATAVSPELKKRMQGKTCFNFSSDPPNELLTELKRLADDGLDDWAGKNWI